MVAVVLCVAVTLLAGGFAARPALVSADGLHTTAGVTDPASGWAPEFVDDHGRPARWDPCLPIRYVVNPEYAPMGGVADVRRAIEQLASATGMTFVDAGPTDELPSSGRRAYQPERYGDRWAPLLIAWVPPASTDLMTEANAEGVTVPIAVPTAHGGVIVSAEIALNAARQLPVGFRTDGPSEGEVLLHELGHAMGLAHVDNPADAMYPTVRGIAAYGEGDLTGLAALGRSAGCLREPKPHRIAVSTGRMG